MGNVSLQEDSDDRLNDDLHFASGLIARLRQRRFLLGLRGASETPAAPSRTKAAKGIAAQQRVRPAPRPKAQPTFEVWVVERETQKLICRCLSHTGARNALKASRQRFLPDATLRIVDIAKGCAVHEVRGTRRPLRPPRKITAMIVTYRQRFRALRGTK